MFDGIHKRVVSVWLPRLASDRALRVRAVDAAFALTLREGNTDRLYCLNAAAESVGLQRGMRFADARAFCPDLISQPARPELDARFLAALRQWAQRYCPWVAVDGSDGLVMDITGAAHLWGGEGALLDDLRARATRAGLSVRLGLADTRGAAWALAHYREGTAALGASQSALGALPVAALRLNKDVTIALQRLGLRTVGALATAARAPLARRFGREVLLRLDQALGDVPDPIAAPPDAPHYGLRLTLPDPIGLVSDVTAATERLLTRLCAKLHAQSMGARRLSLVLRRVDRGCLEVDLRLAAAMNDPARILPLFDRGITGLDAGFGIDQIRLVASVVEPLAPLQISHTVPARTGQLEDLITRLGTRIGLDNIQRFLPADSHIPERSFLVAPAAYSTAQGHWHSPRPRPLRLFAPEPINSTGSTPPRHFRWRRMALTAARITGPERIAPEWWLEDENWGRGLRDYWRVETHQGRRLWLFYTPQNPGWFVQGEFA